MPTRVSVGLSKMVCLPNYGSIGASCHIELELDAKILEGDPECLRLQVRRAYAACRESVEVELAKQTPGRVSSDRKTGDGRNDNTVIPFRKKERTATPGQLRVIERTAARRKIDLQPMLKSLGVNYAQQLSVVTASDLIGALQKS